MKLSAFGVCRKQFLGHGSVLLRRASRYSAPGARVGPDMSRRWGRVSLVPPATHQDPNEPW